MAAIAAAIGVVSVLGGLQAYTAWGIPAGPAVVVVAVVLFGLTFGVGAGFLSRSDPGPN